MKPASVFLLKPLSSLALTTAIPSYPPSHIDAATSNICSARRRSPNKRSWFQRPHHTISSTTTLASHSRPYRFKNLPCIISILEPPPHNMTSMPWSCHALLQILEDSDRPREETLPFFAPRGSLEIVLLLSLNPKNGTVSQLQSVNVHLLPNLNQN